MNHSKIRAFYKEFPFLHDFVHREAVGSVKVARIDRQLLERAPVWVAINHYMAGIEVQKERVLLLDVEGRLLGEVKPDTRRYHGTGLLDRILGSRASEGEPVRDAICHLADQGQLTYLLGMYESDSPTAICLYKLPKRFNLFEWIREDEEAEQKRIRYDLEAMET